MLFISDFELAIGPSGPIPLGGLTVSAVPLSTPLWITEDSTPVQDLSAGTQVTTQLSTGAWSITLPWPSESDPSDVQWLLTRSDGTSYRGAVPADIPGPVSIADLLSTYDWVLASGPADLTLAVPDATTTAPGVVLIDHAPSSGHPIAATLTDDGLVPLVLLPPQAAATCIRVSMSGTQAITDGAPGQYISCTNTPDYALGTPPPTINQTSTGTHLIAPIDGVYRCGIQVFFGAASGSDNGVGRRILSLIRHSDGQNAVDTRPAASGGPTTSIVTTEIRLRAGDAIRALVFTDAGVAMHLQSGVLWMSLLATPSGEAPLTSFTPGSGYWPT